VQHPGSYCQTSCPSVFPSQQLPISWNCDQVHEVKHMIPYPCFL
jgi:hypothetical protein